MGATGEQGSFTDSPQKEGKPFTSRRKVKKGAKCGHGGEEEVNAYGELEASAGDGWGEGEGLGGLCDQNGLRGSLERARGDRCLGITAETLLNGEREKLSSCNIPLKR